MFEDTTTQADSQRFKTKSLIEYALSVYAEPEVETLCLHLQDEYHANVNILLWTCWLQVEQKALSGLWLNDALIYVDTVSQLTVSRLREVRGVIKESSGFTKVQAKLINKHILKAELTAEKIFLQRLQDMTSRFLESQEAMVDVEDALLCPEYYLKFLNIPGAEAKAATLLRYCKHAQVIPFTSTRT